jgi:hypothetical protein
LLVTTPTRADICKAALWRIRVNNIMPPDVPHVVHF